MADDPEMVKSSWERCGLRCMFDERKEKTMRAALSAATDSSDPLYPLFPQGDMNYPGSDDAAEPEPAQRDPDVYDEENIDPETTDRVRVLARSLDQEEADVPPANRKADTEGPLCPLFQRAAKKGLILRRTS